MEFGAACQAGGEGLLPTLFVGAPIIGLAATGVWLLRASVPILEAHRWVILSALGLALIATVPQVLVVTVLGHHTCGPRYDGFIAFLEAWDRWVPVANLVFIAVAAAISLGPYVRKVDSKA